MSIKPGVYRHYKGKEYEVLGIAKLESTLEDLVLYKPLYEQSIAEFWVRPIDIFLEEVEIGGKKTPRFTFISEIKERPKVGLAVIVVKDNKVLVGKRIGSHGENTYAFPGGHLEFAESWEECASRETMEETGLQIDNIRFFTATNDIFEKEKKHYNTVFLLADYTSGEPEVKEPDKCLGWAWISWNDLPSPLFKPIENLLKRGLNPFEK